MYNFYIKNNNKYFISKTVQMESNYFCLKNLLNYPFILGYNFQNTKKFKYDFFYLKRYYSLNFIQTKNFIKNINLNYYEPYNYLLIDNLIFKQSFNLKNNFFFNKYDKKFNYIQYENHYNLDNIAYKYRERYYDYLKNKTFYFCGDFFSKYNLNFKYQSTSKIFLNNYFNKKLLSIFDKINYSNI